MYKPFTCDDYASADDLVVQQEIDFFMSSGLTATDMENTENRIPETELAEQRDFPRFEVNTSGTLILETGFKLSFVVKDLSQRGAKILLNKTSILPEHFTVEIISPDRSKIKRCKAARQWQRGPLAGIRLLNSQTIAL